MSSFITQVIFMLVFATAVEGKPQYVTSPFPPITNGRIGILCQVNRTVYIDKVYWDSCVASLFNFKDKDSPQFVWMYCVQQFCTGNYR
uniref:Secreted salivary protein n=1 Tax=Panagrellus redivivus TaxID=6233 RepID=A0A7E4UX70_PANRE